MKSKIETLKLFYTKKEWSTFILGLGILFLLNLSFLYYKYHLFKAEELYVTTAQIQKVYSKNEYKVLKLNNDDMTFFTSVSRDIDLNMFDTVNITLLTNNIHFIDFIKGFYAQSFNLYSINSKNSIKKQLYLIIQNQHEDENISSLFHALFFALPLNETMREISSAFGLSHLIAISGFHLGIISAVLYWLLYYPYTYFHMNYFSFRNKKHDILMMVLVLLFAYLLFTNVVPSLLRAFVMFMFGLYFVRCNIKLFSFETLLIVLMSILALFPEFVFSLSLWFSITAVFYIFLFLHYFKSLPKIEQFVLFNVWIYLCMNPFSHYFFGTTSLIQLFSPLFTLGFTLFYPIEALAHLFGWGGFLDSFIMKWVSVKTLIYEVFTPSWFFYGYIALSFLAIWFKKAFYILNCAFILFNIYIYSMGF